MNLHGISMPAKSRLLTLLFLPACSILSLCQTPPGNQDQISLHSRMAQQYIQEQRPDLAIPELQKLIAVDPGNIDARANLGVLLFFGRSYSEAIPQLRSAIQLKPDLWKVRGLLGLAEGEVGDGNASREDLEAAFPHLDQKTFQEEVGEALIDDYTATEDLEKASAVVSTLLASRPTDAPLLYMAYRLSSDSADKTMLTLALTAPNSAEMHHVMARELARHGDNAPAIANYREAIKIDPRLSGLHSEFGDLLYHSDDSGLKAQAEDEFRTAWAVNPNDELAQRMLGEIAEKRDDLKSAYADYSRALELQPNDSDACTDLAKALVEMNRNQEALKMFERAVQIDPTDYVAHYRLSTLYREAGNESAAKQQVAEYLKYKQMKDKLKKIFQDMRVLSDQNAADDKDER